MLKAYFKFSQEVNASSFFLTAHFNSVPWLNCLLYSTALLFPVSSRRRGPLKTRVSSLLGKSDRNVAGWIEDNNHETISMSLAL